MHRQHPLLFSFILGTNLVDTLRAIYDKSAWAATHHPLSSCNLRTPLDCPSHPALATSKNLPQQLYAPYIGLSEKAHRTSFILKNHLRASSLCLPDLPKRPISAIFPTNISRKLEGPPQSLWSWQRQAPAPWPTYHRSGSRPVWCNE